MIEETGADQHATWPLGSSDVDADTARRHEPRGDRARRVIDGRPVDVERYVGVGVGGAALLEDPTRAVAGSDVLVWALCLGRGNSRCDPVQRAPEAHDQPEPTH